MKYVQTIAITGFTLPLYCILPILLLRFETGERESVFSVNWYTRTVYMCISRCIAYYRIIWCI